MDIPDTRSTTRFASILRITMRYSMTTNLNKKARYYAGLGTFLGVLRLLVGRRERNRTADPHHVKVVL